MPITLQLHILKALVDATGIPPAEAIQAAFKQSASAREVLHVDALDYTNKVFRHLYSKAYLDMVNRMPEAMGWLYDHLDKPWTNQRRRLRHCGRNRRSGIINRKQRAPGASNDRKQVVHQMAFAPMATCFQFEPSEMARHGTEPEPPADR